jgi:hypothetical protein
LPSRDQPAGPEQPSQNFDVKPSAVSMISMFRFPAALLENATLDPSGLADASSAPLYVN